MNLSEIKLTEGNCLFRTYAPYDVVFTKGKGNYLYDENGKEYLDFLAGIAVCGLGHCHPALESALKAQAEKLWVCSNYFYNEYRAPLAKLLTESAPGLNRVFFGNSGAEANECAIKLARKYHYDRNNGRYKIYSALQSFHGRTVATVTATGQPKYNLPYAPLPSGFEYLPFNDIDALKKAMADSEAAALILEPIQGESGVHPATEEYLLTAREETKKHGVLLILDEVQTGMGRTGKMWAHQTYGIVPDIMTAAKSLGGGFPIGACLSTEAVAKSFAPGDHGTTFGSSPLACRMALETVKIISEPKFLQEVSEKGVYFQAKLQEIISEYAVKIRGKGLMVGAELKKEIAKSAVKEMLRRGYVLNACASNVLRFLPPLTITTEEIDRMTAELKKVLEELNETL